MVAFSNEIRHSISEASDLPKLPSDQVTTFYFGSITVTLTSVNKEKGTRKTQKCRIWKKHLILLLGMCNKSPESLKLKLISSKVKWRETTMGLKGTQRNIPVM